MDTVKGAIHSIETFGSVDGPGVRFVVFFKGCHMRCQYCHNPDTWQPGNADTSADELLQKALRYRTYWGSEGGITISGGEPLLQIDFILDLFQKAKQQHVHTVIDTSGQPFRRDTSFFHRFEQLMSYTDLLLVDIKHIDEIKHKQLTGYSNAAVFDMLDYLNELHKPVWIRHVLIPGINDQEIYLKRLSTKIKQYQNIEKIEILPYHMLGIYKWEKLGIPYELKHVSPPSMECIKKAEAILKDNVK